MTPRRLAERMRMRMRMRQQADDGFVRETFTYPRDAAQPRLARSSSATQLAVIRPRLNFDESSKTAKSSSRCDACRRPTS